MEDEECKRCGYTLVNPAGECSICCYTERCKQLISCSKCKNEGCDVFCQWCTVAYHRNCAYVDGQEIGNNSQEFTCKRCQRDGTEADRELSCGSCKTPFNSLEHLDVGQVVVLQDQERLFNATVLDIQPETQSLQIQFFSNPQSEWIQMDDERLTESMACDACNQWFHGTCLPPLEPQGRRSEYLYVCGKCYLNAELDLKPRRQQQQRARSYSCIEASIVPPLRHRTFSDARILFDQLITHE